MLLSDRSAEGPGVEGSAMRLWPLSASRELRQRCAMVEGESVRVYRVHAEKFSLCVLGVSF